MSRVLGGLALVTLLTAASCGGGGGEDPVGEQLFPDVIGVEATRQDDGRWRFDVTVSSPYDSPDRYADAWRVLGEDGTVFGVRELLHDHSTEQPFTRSLSDVSIPSEVMTVVVEGRDLDNGWGGTTFVVDLGAP